MNLKKVLAATSSLSRGGMHPESTAADSEYRTQGDVQTPAGGGRSTGGGQKPLGEFSGAERPEAGWQPEAGVPTWHWRLDPGARIVYKEKGDKEASRDRGMAPL